MAGGVSLAEAGGSAEGTDVKSMPVSPNGLSSELLEELAALAAEKVRGGGLRLMGEGGLLPELARHLMQSALEAEMDQHLVEEAGRVGGRGSRSGGNMRNGYRSKKVITEVGPVTVRVPRDRLGTFQPRVLPRYARRTGALDELVLSLTAKGLTSGEIVAHLAQTYGMTTTKETISTITDKALESMAEWRTRPLDAGWFPLMVANQQVNAPVSHPLMTSVGVLSPRTRRGRRLTCRATAWRSRAVWTDRSLPLGKYCRSRPLVFSFVPRCQGECGSQK